MATPASSRASFSRGSEFSSTAAERSGAVCFSSRLFSCSACIVNDKELRDEFDGAPEGCRRRHDWVPRLDSEADTGSGIDSEVEDGSDLEDVIGPRPSPKSRTALGTLARMDTVYTPVSRLSTSLAQSSKVSINEDVGPILRDCEEFFVRRGWSVVHAKQDLYIVNGRPIRLFLLPPGIPAATCVHLTDIVEKSLAHKASRVMVNDGPLRQPLLDYLLQSGRNEHYDTRGTESPNAVGGLARNVEFSPPAYDDRVSAMKYAAHEVKLRQQREEVAQTRPMTRPLLPIAALRPMVAFHR